MLSDLNKSPGPAEAVSLVFSVVVAESVPNTQLFGIGSAFLQDKGRILTTTCHVEVLFGEFTPNHFNTT